MKVAIIGAGFLAETRARCWRRVHAADIDGLRRAPAPTVMVAARYIATIDETLKTLLSIV